VLLSLGAISLLARVGRGLDVVAAALVLELVRALSDIWVLLSGAPIVRAMREIPKRPAVGLAPMLPLGRKSSARPGVRRVTAPMPKEVSAGDAAPA
jgi:hypothetical protein